MNPHTPDLRVRLGALELQNPVLTASGTFGYGEEVADLVDLSKLGAIVCKTVTRLPRAGNAPPRTCETPAGMMNAIGLQNVGLAAFKRDKLPFLRDSGTKLIVNIAGDSSEDFAALCADLNDEEGIDALELNISCPNVAHGLDFATDPIQTEAVVKACRAATPRPLFVKLSPNVTDIAVIARAAQEGGADALSVCNTFVGFAIDTRTRRPRLSNGTGGLSGPAIRPLALRAVWRCAQNVQIPIIGIGGIATANDALEFLIAGASAVQVGTATFVRPNAALEVIEGIGEYLSQHEIASVRELTGSLQA
ncbi:dihydroorotate dehydrogenase B (NAD(+)) catalytic subunit [Abditibacteriota bacterium]|nr:dihydroorotate dehydrogenase B (NAD(+)) catalytic subunit [Abditibacteriota bacterium]